LASYSIPRAEGERLRHKQLQRDIYVATRQYAKRQLTWFARENKLASVMLTGHPSFPAALRAARVPDLS
jgi:tRNA A37 N6-isopentenylltransferase MiaA